MNAMKNSLFIIASICLTILSSCKNNESQTSIFTRLEPSNKNYKDALARKIAGDTDNIIYILNSYKENNGKEFLNVNIEGPDFNATGIILVDNWNKLEKIKGTKGLGYSGAELKGLKVGIEENPNGAILRYKDLKEIVD
ncbi:hypothetical protein [Pedobacter jejuensis]|uniref:Uncharacterized protein n=1 Tax=Pedobacter jejuensis TaxID=1268550 RepID=A0A3N0C087_9SPHI|nr:hypothetical protein [Pedobacter jejuensis]RNL55159.1 hypothetical protein D7004_05595 [Pedobacter jejuensis]